MELSQCHVIAVSTWRHEVTEPTIHILACRCARKLILFLFLWYFESRSSQLLLISHLYDAVTSWRHVTTSQNLIYLSQLVDVLESWFFFCFHGFSGHWVSKNVIDFSFLWWNVVRMSCHDVTKPIYLSQLVDVLESGFFFFVSMGFLVTEFQKCHWFLIFVMKCRHDVMSWRHKIRFTYLSL